MQSTNSTWVEQEITHFCDSRKSLSDEESNFDDIKIWIINLIEDKTLEFRLLENRIKKKRRRIFTCRPVKLLTLII